VNVIDRPATHSTYYPGRVIRGGVLHSTQTSYPITTQQSLGGWNYLVGRDGTVYRDCDEDQCAWHVRACDRWRPAWVVNAPDNGISPVNYSAIGIEIQSSGDDQAGPEPYTDSQYDALVELIADIESRHGSLWWVGHGDVQADRSDPVAFDWDRAGLGPHDGDNGRAFVAREQEDDEVACMEELAAMTADRDRLDYLRAECENALNSAAELRKMRAKARLRGVSLWDYLQARARGEG